ncbi:MAG: MerR family transcriptional regulator [Microbacterium sp.]
MAAATARGAAPHGLLSIGQVLALLEPDFPALTSSKLRFLEVQGIVTPRRTQSGYRKFAPADVERLRLALTLQRDHYLPLQVIREYLDDVAAGSSPALPAGVPRSIVPPARRFRRDDLLREAAAPSQLLNDAIGLGLIPGGDSYDDRALTMLRSLVALDRHGIEPRHLRALRQSAERDVALVESALAPLRRRSDAAARGRAAEVAGELSRRLGEVRESLVRQALERLEG